MPMSEAALLTRLLFFCRAGFPVCYRRGNAKAKLPWEAFATCLFSALRIHLSCSCTLTTELPSAIKPPSAVEFQGKMTGYLQVPAARFVTPWETTSSPLWWGSWEALSPNTARTQCQECCPYVHDRLFCNFESVNFPFCLLRSSFSKYESLLQEEKTRPLWLKV